MSFKVLARAIFIMWIIVITVVSIMPHAEDGLIESSNITESGMEKHLIAYFIVALFCYYAFRRDHIVHIFLSGGYIFFYSLILEVLQFFLLYRTFNLIDIAANVSGIILFVVIWSLYFYISMSRQKE